MNSKFSNLIGLRDKQSREFNPLRNQGKPLTENNNAKLQEEKHLVELFRVLVFHLEQNSELHLLNL